MPATAFYYCIWAFEKVQVYNPGTFIIRIAHKFIEKDCVFLKEAFGTVAAYGLFLFSAESWDGYIYAVTKWYAQG